MLANRFIRFLFIAMLSGIALLIVGIVAAPEKVTAGANQYNQGGVQVRRSAFSPNLERAMINEKLESLRSSRYEPAVQVRHSAFSPNLERALINEKVESLRSSRYAAASSTNVATEQIRGSSLGPSYSLVVRAAADHSSGLIEQIRGSSLGPSYLLNVPAAVASVDSSMDRIEALRAQRSVDAAYSGWIEKIEQLRLERNFR